MDWERMRERLESVLNAPMQTAVIPEEEWDELANRQGESDNPVKSVNRDHDIWFVLAKSNKEVTILKVTEVLLTQSERLLIELMVESKEEQTRKKEVSSLTDDEGKANQLRHWLLQQLEKGASNVELPDALVSQSSLYTNKVPLLLYSDYSQSLKVTYSDLKKLLESFFEAEITLIPLMEKEWLILASEALLASGSEDRDGDEEESLEQTLDAFGSGIYEMLANEWLGECHLAVHYPMKPAKTLLATVGQLRETILLGRTFHAGSFIHLPWELHLEKLLHLVDDDGKSEFLERVLRGTDHVLDTETLMTLEQFFALDCNVSETAKKLYIHRNTLLYRLDRFKNETGLDVRTFNHAVWVRLALLLYKVTKRK